MRPPFFELMLPNMVDEAPEGATGFRRSGMTASVQLVIDNGKAKAVTRCGADCTANYGPVVEAAAELPAKTAIIDDEMVLLNAEGRCDYLAFKKAIKAAQTG
jgi:bifunctional non-homologous end joining protein LigD